VTRTVRHHGDARALVRRMAVGGPIRTTVRVADDLEVTMHGLRNTGPGPETIRITMSFAIPLPLRADAFARWVMACVATAWAHEAEENVTLDGRMVMERHEAPKAPKAETMAAQIGGDA
jgi:hypothetical protein